jgi:hypothetical protein
MVDKVYHFKIIILINILTKSLFKMKYIVFYSFCCVFIPLVGNAQKQSNGKAAKLTITKTNDFTIKADTADQNWKHALWISLTQRGNSEVKYNTKVKLLYSEKGIYALYWCEDKSITSSITKENADIYREDVVEIFFWTDEKYPLYFEYELSPLNYELVLLVPKFNNKFLGWIPWHYEGERTTQHETNIVRNEGEVLGWIGAFFIPFSLLNPLNNVPPKTGTQWRINMYRIDYDNGTSSWTWQPVKTNFHEIESYGTLVFK